MAGGSGEPSDSGVAVKRCEMCKGEGEVDGYFEEDACTCCREGGCGPGTGCGCWHQGKEFPDCKGTGMKP